MSARTFKWTVEIEVNEAEVADGINIDRPFSLHQAIMRGWPYMDGSHLTVKVLKSPSPESIAIAQGAYKRIGLVPDFMRDDLHVLVEVDGKTFTLCGRHRSKVGNSDCHDTHPNAPVCPECKRRDES